MEELRVGDVVRTRSVGLAKVALTCGGKFSLRYDDGSLSGFIPASCREDYDLVSRAAEPPAPVARHKPASECGRPGLCDCLGMPRCPRCNYTVHDADHLMDHHLCDGAIPAHQPDPDGPLVSLEQSGFERALLTPGAVTCSVKKAAPRMLSLCPMWRGW